MVHFAYILLPLYIYPLANTWNPLYDAISANPDVPVYTIVNPNSGPGDGEFPNSDYAPAIAKLRSFPNVKTLGYVRTNWAARPLEEITNEVDTYAGWKNYADADVQVDGIFFDESPTETGAHFDVIKSAADHARTVLATGHDHIVLNPGTPPAPAYFDIADDNTAYEISASSFSVGNISPATANQSSVILYNFQGTEAQLRGNTSAIVNAGVKGLYITAADGYTSFGSSMSQFFAAVSAANKL